MLIYILRGSYSSEVTWGRIFKCFTVCSGSGSAKYKRVYLPLVHIMFGDMIHTEIVGTEQKYQLKWMHEKLSKQVDWAQK